MPVSAEEMANRRQVILDAAEKLIRRMGSLDFTMAALAKTAGVSLATPYNLFESKASILYALLNKSMDGVVGLGEIANAEPDPFVRMLRAAEAVALFFSAGPENSAFYRALLQFLLGVNDPVHRQAFMRRSVSYWRRAADGLEQARLFSPGLPKERFAMEMMASLFGITNFWFHAEITDDEYVAWAGYAALFHMLGLARGRRRQQILELLQECQGRLPAHFGFRGGPGDRLQAHAAAKSAASGSLRMRRAK